jgi:flagellar M-ring protein FliF
MDEVEFARVHLNMPEQSPFIEDTQEAKGSVMVKLSPRYRVLSSEKVAAIQNLVATADSRLDPEKISVIDSKLNLLSVSREKEEEYAGLPDRLSLQRQFESQETQKIKDFLERRFGPGNVAVGVSAELNFDRIEKESKTFTPMEGTAKGVLSKEEIEDEKTTGSGAQGAQGVPGTSSNIPGYPSTEQGTYENKRSHEVKEYNVSESSEHTILAPGDIEKLSVSVLINGEKEDAVLVKEVEGLVLAATNLDQTRGDKIKVTMAPFDTTYLTELEAAQAEAEKFDWKSLIKWIPPAVVLLIAFILFMRLIKPVKGIYRPPREEEVVEEDVGIEMPRLEPAAMRKLKMREEIAKLAEHDPESAARIIKTWLSQ